MKASIIYNSHTGTTKAFASAIGTYLSGKGVETQVGSIDNFDRKYLASADLVLLGCWTSGLMVIAQHPDRPWQHFASRLPDLRGKRMGLFTTYKLATGSMFRRMEAKLKGKINPPGVRIRSKARTLSPAHMILLDELIAG